MIGTWDDHDYGINNGDRDFKGKDTIRNLWLDFIDEPAGSERRTQKNTSIHQDYFIMKTLGDTEITVHVILLDNRYEYDAKTNDRLGSD